MTSTGRVRTLLLLLGLLLVTTASPGAGNQAAEQVLERPEVLPRWETDYERSLPPAVRELDEVTPPPPNPVHLAPEYAHQAGVIVRYPYSFESIFAGMVDAFQDVGVVYILVANSSVEQQCINELSSFGVPEQNLHFIHTPSDAIWTRDYGPWFVEDGDSLAVSDMRYYDHRPSDNAIPEQWSDERGLGYYMGDFYHEGGNMMTDGHGRMFMTTRVLERNPGMTEAEVRAIYRDYFGMDTTLIFERIAFDGTGHIDLWSKVMNDTTILVAELLPDDPNYSLVEQHVASMEQLASHTGNPFHIVRIPMPPLIETGGGNGYYRSYVNSILFNYRAVIPIFGLPTDGAAIAAYQEALGPEWEVIGIDCNDIVPLGGAIHCTAIGVPHGAGDELLSYLFGHMPELTGEQTELTATLALNNVTGAEDTVAISLSSTLPEGWSFSYTTPEGPQSGDASVSLAVGQMLELPLSFTSGPAGTVGTVELDLVSLGDTSAQASHSFASLSAGAVMVVDNRNDGSASLYSAALAAQSGEDSLSWSLWPGYEQVLPFSAARDAGVEIVVWGSQAPGAVDPAERGAMLGFLDQGGHLYLSGRNNLMGLGTDAWQRLGLQVQSLYTGQALVEGVPGDPLADDMALSIEGGDGMNNVAEPLVLGVSGSGSHASMSYAEGGTAALRTEAQAGSGRAFSSGFNFEALASADERAELMAAITGWLLVGGTNSAEEQANQVLPRRFELEPSWPNPFNPAANIAFSLSAASHVEVEVFDLLGRRVAQLADGVREAGRHRLVWDASGHASGLYLLRVTASGPAGSERATQKLMLMK